MSNRFSATLSSQDVSMNKILVTGATGHLGRETLEFLLKQVPASQLVALARDPAKLADLAERGVDVRAGDYFDPESLSRAFEGIDKVLLVSAVAFTDRITQHRNVIAAAKAAGVKQLVYTSIQRKAGSSFSISMVTESDKATEQAIKDSGIAYTILRNTLYLDAVPLILGNAVLDEGVRVPGGSGQAPLAVRSELAEANALVLTQAVHENKTYTLGASETFSFADVAAVLSEIKARPLPYADITVQQFIDEKVAGGFPAPAAVFLAEWIQAVAVGEFTEVTGDLERLIGRKPTGYREFLQASYAGSAA
jgi:NAD(P)H dehydrogenase (quinone)